MKTEKVNFTGMYIIPNTPKNVQLIKEKVAPMYNHLKHENIIGIEGENPYMIGVEVIKELIGKSQGASKQWLMMNAKRFGIALPELNSENLLIVSGKKDISKLADFFQERINANLKSPLQRFFDIFTKHPDVEPNLPEHLKLLPELVEGFNRETKIYKAFLSKENVVNVQTPQELLAKILTEK